MLWTKMKTEIENLFDLSSCEHDSYSSSAVCHFPRVLYKNAWISIDWQITFWGDRLTPKRLSWPMAFYAGPSMQAPPLSFACSPRAVFKKTNRRLLRRLWLKQSHCIIIMTIRNKTVLKTDYAIVIFTELPNNYQKEAVKKWLEHKRLKYID